MNYQQDEVATMGDAAREFARNVGSDLGDAGPCWILCPFDTWERNPFYVGPSVRHPEEDEGT